MDIIRRKIKTLGWAEMPDGSHSAIVRADYTLEAYKKTITRFFIGGTAKAKQGMKEVYDAQEIIRSGRPFPPEWAKEILESAGYNVQEPKQATQEYAELIKKIEESQKIADQQKVVKKPNMVKVN